MVEEVAPVLRYQIGSTVVPGDRIGTIRQIRSGKGTYVKSGHVYACMVGTLELTLMAEEESKQDASSATAAATATAATTPTSSAWACSVGSSSPPASSQVLTIGQLVVGKVTRITPQNALVEILVAEHVGPLVSHSTLEGAIRMEDVTPTTVGAGHQHHLSTIGDCFQPGDLVVCRVLSLGDARRYFLSTAETELGVIRATRTTNDGNVAPMIPISWKEMKCPETGIKVSRKCAKPPPAATSANKK